MLAIAPDMEKDQLSPCGSEPNPVTDADLDRIVHVIVHDFNGDTSAYFASIRPGSSVEKDKTEQQEAVFARQFAKSV
jgi:hypothetical protein